MQAYLIDAAARTITPIEYSGYDFRTYLPGGICIGQVFRNGDVLYVDDMALLKKAAVAFRIKDRPDGQPMMSNGILTGPDSPRGTTTEPPQFTTTELAQHIEWLTVEDALTWFRGKADEAAVISHSGGISQVHASWADLLRNLEGGDGYHPGRDESLINRL